MIEQYVIKENYIDDDGNPINSSEIYIDGVKQELAPKEYAEYVPIDASMIEISTLFCCAPLKKYTNEVIL